MIIKKDNTYILSTPGWEGDVAWIPDGSNTVEITKSWEAGQIFQYKLNYLGCFAINKQLLLYLKGENRNFIIVNYKKGDDVGKICVDINVLLETGELWHNPVKPYDNQLVLLKKNMQEFGDEKSKEILAKIWQDKTLELKQEKELNNHAQLN